ncbi:MAG: hypothetical protein PHP45_04940 [Elusimicrobiales bacterium]|nr:hypothetical protein [Elusimicrobiales bacterium]
MRFPIVLCAVMFAAITARAAEAPSPSPLHRNYTEGEKLHYSIEGAHYQDGKKNHDYNAQAEGIVVKDSSGVFHEEVLWTKAQAEYDDNEIILSSAEVNIAQQLSLDPGFRPALPDLSKVHQALIGPITDLLTFYTDDYLAIRKQLRNAGDHVFIPRQNANSWAGGVKIVIGYDCVDFDITLSSMTNDTATLHVRHQPPAKGCSTQPPAEWMSKPVTDIANNWFEVQKIADSKYDAAAGNEVFDAELKIAIPAGAIKSATMHNPVDMEHRICKDLSLSDCDAPRRSKITREIKLFVQDSIAVE